MVYSHDLNLPDWINKKGLAIAYYKKQEPESNYTPAQAKLKFELDGSLDLRRMRQVLTELFIDYVNTPLK